MGWGGDIGYYKSESGMELRFEISDEVVIKRNANTGEILIENANDLEVSGTNKDDKITIRNSRISDIETKDGNDKITILSSVMDDSCGDHFNTGTGDDTVIIEDSTVLDEINTGKGADRIQARNAWLSEINSGDGNDDISLRDVTVYQNNTEDYTLYVNSGDGNDKIWANNSVINQIKGEDGKDKIIIGGYSRIAEILGGDDADEITIDKSQVTSIEGNSGDDKINIINNSYVNNLEGNGGIDKINVRNNSGVDDLYGGLSHDEINIYKSNVKRIEGGAVADMWRWFTGDDTVIIDNSETGKTNTGSGKDTVKVNNSNTGDINTGSGNDEVVINESNTGNIETGNGEDNVTVEKSRVGKVHTGRGNDQLRFVVSFGEEVSTGNGDDSVAISGSEIGKVDLGKGNDDVVVQKSEVEEIETGAGNDTVVLDDSEVTTVDTGKGNDIVDVNNGSEVGKVDSGKGKDVVFKDSSSEIKEIEEGEEVVTTDDMLINVSSLDETTAIEAQNLTSSLTSQYSDRELTAQEQYYALTIDVFSDQLESIKSQYERQENADGVVGDTYNFVKGLLDAGVTKEEVEKAIAEQETMVNELKAALNSEDSSTFEEVFKNWTGVEYNQENISEFLEYQQLYTFAVAGEKMVESFAQEVSQAGTLESVYNMYVDHYGSEEKARAELNTVLKGIVLHGGTNGYDTENIMINENNQVCYIQTKNEINTVGTVSYSKTSKVCNLNEFQNIFNSEQNRTKMLKNLVEDYKTNFEATMGYSIETLQAKYSASQVLAMGTNNSFQKLADEYCFEQSSIENQFARAEQLTGVGLIIVGGVLCFVPPLSTAGSMMMKAGSYFSFVGSFVDNSMDLIDSATSEDGLSEEKAKEIFKETVIDAALYLSGRAINGIAESAHLAASAEMAAKGASEALQKLVGWTAEVGTDTALSLLSDLIITGEIDLAGEGLSQLIGILSGIAGAKVKEYNESIGKTNVSDTDVDTRQNFDIDGTTTKPITDAGDYTDANFESYKTASDAEMAGHEMGQTVVGDDGEWYTFDRTENKWLIDPETKQRATLYNWATDSSTRNYDSRPVNENAATDFEAEKLNVFSDENSSMRALIDSEYDYIRQYGDYQTDWGTGKLLESNIPELQETVTGVKGEFINTSPYSEKMILMNNGPWTFRNYCSNAKYRASLNVVGDPNIIKELDTFWETGEYTDINGNKIKLDNSDMTKFSYKTYTDVSKWDSREDPITMYFADEPSEAMKKAITDISMKYQRGSLSYPSSTDTPWLSFDEYPNQEMIDDLFKMTENDSRLYSEVYSYLSAYHKYGEYNISEGQYKAIKNIIEQYIAYKNQSN